MTTSAAEHHSDSSSPAIDVARRPNPDVALDAAPIIFFDGVCSLCNRSVDFIFKRDRERRFRFAPLQGATAQRLLGIKPGESLNSIVLWERGRTWRRSTAIVQVLRRLGRGWGLIGGLLWLIPRPLRDWGYERIAHNRYRWFGKKESCRLPTPDERQRFLP